MNVTVNVANTCEGAGTDSVILNVNGVEWGEQEVALDAGASQNVGFVVTENAATTYDLDINGLVGSFGMTPSRRLSQLPHKPPHRWRLYCPLCQRHQTLRLLHWHSPRLRYPYTSTGTNSGSGKEGSISVVE